MNSSTLLLLAQNAVDVGNINAACEFYEVALLQSPNDDEVMEAYAEILIHYAQDLDRAKQLLRHAIEVNPREGYVKYLNLAQLCEGDESLQCYRAAQALVEAELRAGGRATRTKQTRKQRQRQSEALQETLATIHCAVAELYLTDLCFRADAEMACESAIKAALRSRAAAVEPHQLQASLRLSQQRPQEALQALRRAVAATHSLSEEHQPTYESKLELGRLLMQVSPPEAFVYLLEVLQLGDNNPYVWFLLGECARLRGRYVDAARLLRRARVMMITSDGDAAALTEVDRAIGVLVEEMGAAEAAAVPEMDAIDPIALLQPEGSESEAEMEDGNVDPRAGASKRTTTSKSTRVCLHANEEERTEREAEEVEDDVELDEPEWESCENSEADEDAESEAEKEKTTAQQR